MLATAHIGCRHIWPNVIPLTLEVHLEGAGATWDGGLLAGGRPGRAHTASRGGSQMVTRTGVGLSPAQGLLTWGQFEIRASASISARRSTKSPALERPSINTVSASRPSGPTGTFEKKLRLATMSR